MNHLLTKTALLALAALLAVPPADLLVAQQSDRTDSGEGAGHVETGEHDQGAEHGDREGGSDHDGHDHGDEHGDREGGAVHDEHHGRGERDDEHDGEDEHDGHSEHDLVRLPEHEIEEFGIVVASAGPGRVETTVELPGEVQPNADRLAHIVPRYSGIVQEVRARIGDQVQQGQVLAVLESDESLASFEVRTLISGTVIGKHITLGEAASRERDAFVIADLSTVWIDLTVYQRDLETIRPGQRADVFVGHDLVHDSGTVSYVTPVVDERTRTATARLVLPNPERKWRPGMFVTARVVVESEDVPLVVPRTALQTVEGRTAVFIETPDGFRPRPLQLGRHGESLVEVVAGIEPGERYVAEGGFTLKAELEKDSFGHGHAH
ncbi:MAG: efflux RND transporter periplasmic adaptor subunit [Candidatus Eisenbacteria bacterium]|uniref:Efflux RND transporter periplasmic adaptor subunit n=1 Tax=Eiseniibacteriota bacterium TaxID=2212470 RepID=A0A956RMK0_UNCEI|nr:efflux RND transporter periplasmic adaptor subunit [Candidatus Eisenbacteria bacterium]